jgi:hypothetical protein
LKLTEIHEADVPLIYKLVHKLKDRGEPVFYQGYGEVLSLIYAPKKFQYQLSYEIVDTAGSEPTFGVDYLTPEQLEGMMLHPLERKDGKIVSWEMR